MRSQPSEGLESMRVTHQLLGESPVGVMYGFFVAGLSEKEQIHIISSGSGITEWEHVSLKVVFLADGELRERVPSWYEMSFVKDLFWDEEETVIQFHPKKSAHVNVHPHVLHLWKKTGVDYELPPKELIG